MMKTLARVEEGKSDMKLNVVEHDDDDTTMNSGHNKVAAAAAAETVVYVTASSRKAICRRHGQDRTGRVPHANVNIKTTLRQKGEEGGGG